ncbi:thioredoxin family protein [Pseudoxanthomonas sp. Root630]|uniref:thioredoxin family protein n=1 Tax=Pseudoxanthomonas sp. Root630 TaxID=1736574 RepID=UPI00070260D0|nr:thioredoxin family protein [Pseudoxanthomonas sp. Root630]KRA50837.1 thioredoxin [Pseudoxanthomonas sp. Root630]
MSYQPHYATREPLRSGVDGEPGLVVLEFGAPWCGHCHAVQPLLDELLTQHPEATHVKVEDGKGRPLGRSFGVTLWPTVIVMEQGKELARAVRPTTLHDLRSLDDALSARVVPPVR